MKRRIICSTLSPPRALIRIAISTPFFRDALSPKGFRARGIGEAPAAFPSSDRRASSIDAPRRPIKCSGRSRLVTLLVSRRGFGLLLVDAYNVLHTVGVLPPDLAGQDVPGLIRLIAHSRYADRELTVVCDGIGSKDRGVSFGHARVLFSGAEREADDLIERLIDRYTKGRTLTVVSSDRRLQRAAKRGRAEGLSSRDFLKHLLDDHRQIPIRDKTGGWAPRAAVPLDPYSVAAWMTEFGFESPPTDSPQSVKTEYLERARTKAAAEAHEKTQTTTDTAFGDRLGLPAIPTPEPAPGPAPEPQPEPESAPMSDQPGVTRMLYIDDALRAALEEWRDVVSEDDLDMSRWIKGVDPI
ncbi:MAG: NYN domain-containing protein [Planctomycetota bacterium]